MCWQVTAWIERAAEKMPEEQYAFKPDPAVRSFGQILGHIADADYLFCSGALGEKNKTTKADLMAALHDAFAYCNRAYDALTDASANETVKDFGQSATSLACCGSTLPITWSITATWSSTCDRRGSFHPPATSNGECILPY